MAEPKPLVTMLISVATDGAVSSDVQTHDNSYAEVARGLGAIKTEIDRVFAERKQCPYYPADAEAAQRKIIRAPAVTVFPRRSPVVQWERRHGGRGAGGSWMWGGWRECTELEARRISGLRSWQSRRLVVVRLELPSAFDMQGIARALRTQRQVDQDGSEVGVSRQAADEAATVIEGLAATDLPAGVGARVLLPADPFCPKCGHNRDRSSVSSIDHGEGRASCQKCGAEWRELAPDGMTPCHGGQHG